MTLAAEYPFLEILGTIVIFFFWVIWIWTLVVVLSDVFRRSDLSGWGKAGWTFFMILLPFLGVLTYLVAHGADLGERRLEDVDRRLMRQAEAAGTGARGDGARTGSASEIAEAKRLLDSGAIDAAEFAQLKRKALA